MSFLNIKEKPQKRLSIPCCAVWGITAAVKNRLGSLLGLEVLGTSVEQSPSNVEQNYAYDVVQSSCGDRGNDLPCDEYANAAADEVAQGSNGVVTTLLDEYERVSGHQQSAGAHEYGEAYAGGAAEELFYSCGMTMSGAISVFLKQSLNANGLPFAVTEMTTEDFDAIAE